MTVWRPGPHGTAGLVVGVLCLLGRMTAWAEPLELETAIRMALSNNLELARGGIGVAKSRLSVQAATEEFSTTVEPSGSLSSTDGDTDHVQRRGRLRHSAGADRIETWRAEEAGFATIVTSSR